MKTNLIKEVKKLLKDEPKTFEAICKEFLFLNSKFNYLFFWHELNSCFYHTVLNDEIYYSTKPFKLNSNETGIKKTNKPAIKKDLFTEIKKILKKENKTIKTIYMELLKQNLKYKDGDIFLCLEKSFFNIRLNGEVFYSIKDVKAEIEELVKKKTQKLLLKGPLSNTEILTALKIGLSTNDLGAILRKNFEQKTVKVGRKAKRLYFC
jgi:hypothetical protein